MSDRKLTVPEGFRGIFVGASTPVEMLYGGVNRSGRGRFWFVHSGAEALDIAAHNDIHAVIIEPASFGGADSTALLAFQLRSTHPQIAIVLFTSNQEFDQLFSNSAPSVRHRLSHYFKLRRADNLHFEYPEPDHLSQVLADSLKWYSAHAQEVPPSPKYRYDVALSFAGEDRGFADKLANTLKDSGVRVFYDSFEQADLWGKNLFEHLYEIYSVASRFCIILVSSSYAEKRWTVHERRSAQERVLNERHADYLLPVRLDSTPLPGLPGTVAYVNADHGANAIARLFIRKLGNVLSEANR